MPLPVHPPARSSLQQVQPHLAHLGSERGAGGIGQLDGDHGHAHRVIHGVAGSGKNMILGYRDKYCRIVQTTLYVLLGGIYSARDKFLQRLNVCADHCRSHNRGQFFQTSRHVVGWLHSKEIPNEQLRYFFGQG